MLHYLPPLIDTETNGEQLTRTDALDKVWKRLFLIFLVLTTALVFVLQAGDDARVPIIVMLTGNVGGYVSIHRSLNDLDDEALSVLTDSWIGLLIPSFIGGILALVLYLLFLSKILAGELFPNFKADWVVRPGFDAIFDQGGDMADYAKLLFWAFVAGFNQKYVVDVIDSVQKKATT